MLTPAQTAELQRMKQWFPYRIVFGVIDTTSLGLNMKLAALTLALASLTAQAGDWHAPKQNPDEFSNIDKHLFYAGLLPGILVGTALPEWSKTAQFALCSAPGLYHEFEPAKGNVWSGRDILVNSIGCGLGLWAATGFSIGATPEGVKILYAVRFQ